MTRNQSWTLVGVALSASSLLFLTVSFVSAIGPLSDLSDEGKSFGPHLRSTLAICLPMGLAALVIGLAVMNTVNINSSPVRPGLEGFGGRPTTLARRLSIALGVLGVILLLAVTTDLVSEYVSPPVEAYFNQVMLPVQIAGLCLAVVELVPSVLWMRRTR